MSIEADADYTKAREQGTMRLLTPDELNWVWGGGDDGSDTAGTLGEVTVCATADGSSDGPSGNPMNLIPSGLGLLGATIGLITATTPLGVALATIAAAGAIMNAVVNNNSSLPQVTPWGGPGSDSPAGP